MAIPNPTHQALSNLFASLAYGYLAIFTGAAGTTGANEATGGGYSRVALSAPVPDGVGDNNFPQVNVPCAAATYEEAGFFSTSSNANLSSPSGLAVAAASGGSLTASTTYYYKITGVNWSGETLPSGEVSVTPSGGNLSASLSWSALAGVSGLQPLARSFAGYNIYRGTSSGGENVLVAFVAYNATSYTDTGAAGTSQSPPGSNTASTFVGSNTFTGGYVTVTGTGASINIAASVTA
jgi:hypothetical protein